MPASGFGWRSPGADHGADAGEHRLGLGDDAGRSLGRQLGQVVPLEVEQVVDRARRRAGPVPGWTP